MALGPLAFETVVVTVAAAGTSVAVSPIPRQNTHTIRVMNENATAIIYVADATAGGSLATTGVSIQPGTYQDLPVGTGTKRPDPFFTLCVDSDINGSTARVTYFNAATT